MKTNLNYVLVLSVSLVILSCQSSHHSDVAQTFKVTRGGSVDRLSGPSNAVLASRKVAGNSATPASSAPVALPPGYILDSSGYAYDPKDRSCDGFPKLMVQTMPGTCLGMVMPRDRAIDNSIDPATGKPFAKSFVKPRTILQLRGTKDFLVMDMGGWTVNNGRLFLLRQDASGVYQLKYVTVPHKLDYPHALTYGPDGKIYIGEKNIISRFDFVGDKIVNLEVVIKDLQKIEGFMHPLTQFVFDPRNGDMYINVGSPSDHCFVNTFGNYQDCPEAETKGFGGIYQIPGEMLKKIPPGGVKNYVIAASGLRNSMALVVHPSGMLIQGENGRDFPELEEPYEELNVMDIANGPTGPHFGWPYCYDFHAVAPEWKFPENQATEMKKRFTRPVDCSLNDADSAKGEVLEAGRYVPPYALMPPHVAPLHMLYYHLPQSPLNGTGEAQVSEVVQNFLPELQGNLLVSWHGYQPTGHRLVAYPVDSRGRPVRVAASKDSKYAFNQAPLCPTSRVFNPAGGMNAHAPYKEVISGWYAIKGRRPTGAPVGFTVADDGSVFIVEDRDVRSVVRLAKTKSESETYRDDCVQDAGKASDPRIALLAWRNYLANDPAAAATLARVQTTLTGPYCSGCHGNFVAKDIGEDKFSQFDFFMKNAWLEPGRPAESLLYRAISHGETNTPMPPMDKPQFFGTPAGDQILKLVSDWISALPTNIESRYARVTAANLRNIRQAPSKTGTVCGQLQAGDVYYRDPRPGSKIHADSADWNKSYFVPGHTRLYQNTCPQPADGVFWVAD